MDIIRLNSEDRLYQLVRELINISRQETGPMVRTFWSSVLVLGLVLSYDCHVGVVCVSHYLFEKCIVLSFFLNRGASLVHLLR